jgi:hypothetical protein
LSLGRVKNCFSTSSRPALGSTQPPVQWVPGAFSPGVKRPGREAEHSPPTSAEVKKMWIYTSTPHTVSWRSVSLVKHRDNFTFYFLLAKYICIICILGEIKIRPRYNEICALSSYLVFSFATLNGVTERALIVSIRMEVLYRKVDRAKSLWILCIRTSKISSLATP